MPININGLTSGSSGSEKARGQETVTKANQKGDSAQTDVSASTDRVELSAEVKVLRKLEAQVSSMSDIDQSKIDRIKAALRNGEYQIDYDNLASAMQKFESDL